MSEKRSEMLDRLLSEEAGQNADCVKLYAEEITPFKDFVSRIAVGIGMYSISLNFGGLGWILPLIGAILVYSGMRGLRTANAWFRAAWLLSAFQLVYRGVLIFLCASPVYTELAGVNNWLGAAIEILMLLCFGKGIQLVNRVSGKAGNAAMPTAALIAWKLAVIALVLLQDATGANFYMLIAIAMVAAFVFIIKSIIKAAEAIEGSGYTIEAAAVVISEKTLWCSLAAIFVAGLLICNVAFHYTPLEWQESEPADSRIVALRSTLEEKGFRKDLLSQIADEDIEDLSGMEISEVVINEDSYNGETPDKAEGRSVLVLTGDGKAKIFFMYEYLDKGICSSRSAVADGVRMTFDEEKSRAGGRVFCTRGGKQLEAVPEISFETVEFPWFDSIGRYSYLKTKYSYPIFSGSQRGYVYVWEDEAVNFIAFNADLFGNAWGIQLPYRELPPINREGGLSFGKPKGYILGIFYNTHDLIK